MHSDCCKQWDSLYRREKPALEEIWKQEKPEMRTVAMLHYVLRRELDNLKTNLANEVDQVKLQVQGDSSKSPGTSNKSEQQKPFNEVIEDLFHKNDKAQPDDDSTTDISRGTTPDLTFVSPQKITLETSPILKFKRNAKRPLNIPKRVLTTRANDSNVIETSIIDNTPEVSHVKRKINKSRKNVSKKLTKNNTLTQMFCDKDKSKIDARDLNQASMDIDQMLSFIGNGQKDSLAGDKTNMDSDISIDFLKNYDRGPVKKDTGPKYAHQEVVRGKEARKKLKGWSCNECKNYYEMLNLSPAALQKKMDDCSKHRAKFKADETYKGFWDLTFGPTPETP